MIYTGFPWFIGGFQGSDRKILPEVTARIASCATAVAKTKMLRAPVVETKP
jgi:hypothetical protein